MNNKIDWVIHLVANGACDECGRTESGFRPISATPTLMALQRMGTWICSWSFPIRLMR